MLELGYSEFGEDMDLNILMGVNGRMGIIMHPPVKVHLLITSA